VLNLATKQEAFYNKQGAAGADLFKGRERANAARMGGGCDAREAAAQKLRYEQVCADLLQRFVEKKEQKARNGRQ
jgi:hypothetical protein